MIQIFMANPVSIHSVFDPYTTLMSSSVKREIFGEKVESADDRVSAVAHASLAARGGAGLSFSEEEEARLASITTELEHWSQEEGQADGEMRVFATTIITFCLHERKKGLCLAALGLSSLPAIIFDFPWIEGLDLSLNKLSYFPVGIHKYPKLKYLHVSQNNFTLSVEDFKRLPPDLCVQDGDDEIENECFSWRIEALNSASAEDIDCIALS